MAVWLGFLLSETDKTFTMPEEHASDIACMFINRGHYYGNSDSADV